MRSRWANEMQPHSHFPIHPVIQILSQFQTDLSTVESGYRDSVLGLLQPTFALCAMRPTNTLKPPSSHAVSYCPARLPLGI